MCFLTQSFSSVPRGKLYFHFTDKKLRRIILPKVTPTCRLLRSQKTAELGFFTKSGTLSTGSLFTFRNYTFFFCCYSKQEFINLFIDVPIQNTGNTVYKAPFLKAVLHSNRKNKTHLGIYELKQEVKHVIKEIQK